MSPVLTDIRYASRLLLKRPGVAFLTISVLAVCIALSLYMFTFLHTMAFKALPFEDGEDIVVFDTIVDGFVRGGNSIDARDAVDLRERLGALEEFVAMVEGDVTLTGRDESRHYVACRTEPGLFTFTRTQPVLGRPFTEAENRPGAGNVVLLGHDVWQNVFGGDPGIVDETVRIDGEPTRVIGVMPPGFRFPRNSHLWMPLRKNLANVERGTGQLVMLAARVADGSSIEAADREVKAVMADLEARYPGTNHRVSAWVTTFPWTQMGDGGMLIVGSCWSVALLLLLLGGVNVGNLLLSRALERDRETATRLALGAPTGRLLMQMMWEGLLIVAIGSVAGLLLAGWALESSNLVLQNFSEDEPYYWWHLGLDAFSLRMFAAMVLVTILLAAAMPAWRVVRGQALGILQDGTRGSAGRSAGRFSRSLVIIEVLLSVTILIAAGVTLSGALRAGATDFGATLEGIYTARISIPRDRYPEATSQARFANDLRSTLLNAGGIEGVGIMDSLPGTYASRGWPDYEIEGVSYSEDRLRPSAQFSTVLPGTMESIGMRLLEGRRFAAGDDADGLPVAVVTASMAEKNWPGESALGKRLRLINAPDGSPWRTVVGVVGNTTHTQPIGDLVNRPSIYVPMAQHETVNAYVAMTTSLVPAEALKVLRTALYDLDPEAPAYYPGTYRERVSYLTGGVSFIARMFGLFGIVALLLAASGIYGVMSNTIAQRTHEIGLKRALGATDRRVYFDFFSASRGQMLMGALPGALVGGALGVAVGAMVENDYTVLVVMMLAAPLLIMGVVALGTWLPVRRALKMEPGMALHHE